MLIGERIKSLRILRNMTQEELAVRSDLTRGFISQLERNLTSPTIENLEMVLRALGTNLKDFFSKMEDEERVVYKKDDRIPIYDSPEGIQEELLLTISEPQKIEPALVLLEPNSETAVENSHEGFEFGFVIEGQVTLFLNDSKHKIKSEESFFFKSNKDHYIKNTSKSKKAKVLWIEIY